MTNPAFPPLPQPPPLPPKKSYAKLYVLLATLGLAALALVTFGVVKVVEQVNKRNAARTQLTALQKEMAEGTRKDLENHDSVKNSSERLDAYQKKMSAISENMPETDKIVLKAGQEIIAELQPALKSYQAAFNELIQNKGYNPEGLLSREDCQRRREIIHRFSDANQKLTVTFAALGDHLNARMKALGISAAKSEAATKAFTRSANGDLVAIIREQDRLLGLRMTDALDLFEECWGKWSVNKDGKLIFQETATLDRYNKLATEIADITKKQATAQGEMVKRQTAATTK